MAPLVTSGDRHWRQWRCGAPFFHKWRHKWPEFQIVATLLPKQSTGSTMIL